MSNRLAKILLSTWTALVSIILVWAVCVFLYSQAPVLIPMTYATGHGETPSEPMIAVNSDLSLVPASATANPTNVTIPKIGLSAPISALGVDAKGNMAVPANNYETSWYNEGAKPGTRGNAVLAGHWKWNGGAGVFTNLHKVTVGDDIFVTDAAGNKYQYRVVRTKLIDATEKNTDDIFGPTDGYHLNLITCAGAWAPEINTYRSRLIVFAERVG